MTKRKPMLFERMNKCANRVCMKKYHFTHNIYCDRHKAHKKTAQIKRINDLTNEPNENLNGYDMICTSSLLHLWLIIFQILPITLMNWMAFSHTLDCLLNEYILTIYFELQFCMKIIHWHFYCQKMQIRLWKFHLNIS